MTSTAAADTIFAKKHGYSADVTAAFAPVVQKLFAFLHGKGALDTDLQFRIRGPRLACIDIGPLPFEFCLISLAEKAWSTLAAYVSVTDVRWTSVVTGTATLAITFELADRRASAPLRSAPESRQSSPIYSRHVAPEESFAPEPLFLLFHTCWLSFEQELSTENRLSFGVSRSFHRAGAALFLTNVIAVDADCTQDVVVTQSMVERLTRAASNADIGVQSLKLNGLTRTITFILRLDNFQCGRQ